MPTIQPGKDILVTVKSATLAESPNTGTPGVFMEFENDSGSIDGTLWVTEKAIEHTVNTLRKCFSFNNDFSTLTSQVEGKKCLITVEMEADAKGKEWPRVRWVNSAARRERNLKPSPASLVKELTTKAKGIAKQVDDWED